MGVLNEDTGQYDYPPEVTTAANRALDDLREKVANLDHYLEEKVREPDLDPPDQE